MIVHPLCTPDVLNTIEDWQGNWIHFKEMQEALQCEWLIEQDLMQDPSRFDCTYRLREDFGPRNKGLIVINGWVCEDKTL